MSTAGEKKNIAFTPEQGAATDPDFNVWVSASAGTGKTQVLTARVLRLLLGDVPPEQILCVTFTKAAAAEMAQRLFDTLAGWVSLPDDALFDVLHGYLGVPKARDKIVLARTLFARTLDARGGLKIQTLHSFCQSLLTRFPLEAGITPGFTTLDERTDSHLQAEALDSGIARAFNQHDTRFLYDLHFLSVRTDDDRLLKAIRKFTAALADADPAGHLTADGMEPRIRTLLGLPLAGDAHQAVQKSIDTGALDSDTLRYLAKTWAQGGQTIRKLSGHLQLWLDQPVLDNISALTRAFFTAAHKPRATGTFKDSKVLALDPYLEDKGSKAQKEVEKLLAQLRLYQIADQTAAALRLALSILQTMRQAKNALGLVSFNDLIGKVANLLGAGGSDWVRFKLDDRISHVLVDEAQDTNADQWSIINALTDDFFSGAGAQRASRSVFVVGDFKQSIFRFQGADPKTFMAEKPKLAHRVVAGGEKFLPLDLDISFRSAPAIIDFVNTAISTLGPENLGSASGFDMHKAHRTLGGGEIHVWPLTPRDKADVDPTDLRAELERDWEEKPERATATRIANQISQWLAPGSTERLLGRRIMPQDIMILVRKRGIIAQALVSDLKSRGVAVAGADRMKPGEQLGVQDMLACARFCLQPEDNLTLAGLLKSPFFDWTDDQLFDLAYPRGPGQSLWTALRTHTTPQAHSSVQRLLALLAASDTSTPFQFFAHILERDGGRAALFARLGSEVDDPLTALLDAALAFEQDHAPSLQAFVAWMEEDDSELKRDPDAPRNEVRVMTVHGAKGLEAPIVILADSHMAPGSRETIAVLKNATVTLPVWAAKKELRVGPVEAAHVAEQSEALQDYWRLFYVAITRARDRLYFAGWEPHQKPAAKTWYQLAEDTFAEAVATDGDEPYWPGSRSIILPNMEPPQADSAIGPAPDFVVPDWASSLAPDEPVPPRPLTPSQLGGEDLLVADPPQTGQRLTSQKAAAKRGAALHRLLELLPQIASADRGTSAVTLLAHADMPPESHAVLMDEVTAVLADPAFAAVFGPQSLAEVPVTALLGAVVLSGQIDRLAVSDTEVLIVDYKTTAKPPGTPEAVPQPYLRQMAAYRSALRQIYPAHTIRCALLWTATPALMPLPDALLDAAAHSFATS